MEGAKCIGELANLTKLCINNNNIGNEGCESICGLHLLRELGMKSNNISKANNIENLTQLTKLDISSNTIGYNEHKWFSKLVHLTDLNIERNYIVNISGIGQLTQMKHLNIAINNVGEKGAIELKNLKHLTDLNIMSCKIGTNGVKEICNNLKQLKSLTIAYNQMQDDLDEMIIKELPQLTFLDLRGFRESITRINNTDTEEIRNQMRRYLQ